MKRILYSIVTALAIFAISCSSNNLYDELPTEITKFLAQYYPDPKIDSYHVTDSTYRVLVNNGPTLQFGENLQWTSVDGNGSTLPHNFLFNELPPDLYEYLQTASQLNDVFAVTRDKTAYTVTLLKSNLVYDIATGQITGNI